MRFSSTKWALAAAMTISTLCASAASAASVSFVGASGDLAAGVTFELTGSNTLTVTLQNTATVATPDNAALLEDVFWSSNSLGAVGTVAYLSGVVIPTGSAPVAPATTSSNFGVYGFGTGGGSPVTGDYGVGGTAWDLNFDGSHLLSLSGSNPNPTNSPDGPNGGLASSATTSFSPKDAINDTLVYSIHVASGFDVNSIKNVTFTYGTGSDDFTSFGGTPPGVGGPPPVPTPLPAALWSGLATLGVLGLASRLKKKLA